MAVTSSKDGMFSGMDQGKYVRYTAEQVEALERLYHDCPKPSSIRRQQLIRECPILSNTPDEGLINTYILSKPVKFQDIVLFLLLCKEYH
jgi:hypothetical protein